MMTKTIDEKTNHEYDDIRDSIKDDEIISEPDQSSDKYQTTSTNTEYVPERILNPIQILTKLSANEFNRNLFRVILVASLGLLTVCKLSNFKI